MKHLANFDKESAELILSGKKNIEIRFSKGKIAPFGQISSGDLVYIKPRGEDIAGQFRVKKVIFFDNPNLSDLSYLSGLSDLSQAPRYATLIFIGQSTRFITSPIKSSGKRLNGWMVLD